KEQRIPRQEGCNNQAGFGEDNGKKNHIGEGNIRLRKTRQISIKMQNKIEHRFLSYRNHEFQCPILYHRLAAIANWRSFGIKTLPAPNQKSRPARSTSEFFICADQA